MLPLALKGAGIAPVGNDISGSGLSFGMGADSPNIALSGPGSYGWNSLGSSMGAAAPGASQGASAPQAASPAGGATNLQGVTVNGTAPSMIGATNLPAINVSAMPTISAPSGLLGSLIAPSMPSAPISATNLSPVHVTAQEPTGFLGTLANFKADHPGLYQGANIAANLLTGGLTTLPSMVVNAYLDHMNGKSMIGSLLPPGLSSVGDALGSMFSGLGGHGGSSTPQQANNGVLPTMMQNGSGNPGDTSFTGGSGGILTGAPLPDYAGLSALGGFGQAPMGGYWNQQALHMANPTYGPYAGIGSQSAPQAGPTISPISGMTQPKPLGSPMPFAPFGQPHPINDNNPYAPSGITTAGY